MKKGTGAGRCSSVGCGMAATASSASFLGWVTVRRQAEKAAAGGSQQPESLFWGTRQTQKDKKERKQRPLGDNRREAVSAKTQGFLAVCGKPHATRAHLQVRHARNAKPHAGLFFVAGALVEPEGSGERGETGTESRWAAPRGGERERAR